MRSPHTLPLDDRFEVRINSFVPAANNHLFNEPEFFRLHASSANDVYAQLVRSADSTVFATIAVYDLGDGAYASPRQGTFGGVGLNCACELPLIERFLLVVLGHVKAAGAGSIELKCPPFSHDLALMSVVSNILLRRGAVLSGWELNYDMQVDRRALLERIDYGNVKRIRKCLRQGFSAQKLPDAACAQVHQLISDNRARRGYALSMSAEQLAAMASLFPGRLHFFAVYPRERAAGMAAAAVCMALTPKILYVFYWGDSAGMESYSPTAMLAGYIYEFCQSSGFALLDAGTSTVDGEPNHGLARFKKNLGFSESLKLAYRWPT